MISFYPWVQREELATRPQTEPGEMVDLVSADGAFLGRGFANPRSRFPVRLLTTRDEPIDEAFFAARWRRALILRERMGLTSCRLAFSEGDLLPGLIVDRYADVLVVQVRNAGMERLRHLWLPTLLEVAKPRGVIERSDMEARDEEGLERVTQGLHGDVPDRVEFEEGGLRFHSLVRTGPKTGFYLDQRENRARLAQEVRPGERVLDLFCFSGPFSLAAARAGAEAHGVDILPEAVELAREHAAQNGLTVTFEVGNAFDWLAAQPESPAWDWMIVDPPAIAKSRDKKNSLKWAIWKLVYTGLPRLKDGGRMLVCNCSYQMSLETTIETIRLAASDRGMRVFVEAVTLQPPDHPYLAQFPESLYLKSVWARFESARG